jgi:hypothetical protein
MAFAGIVETTAGFELTEGAQPDKTHINILATITAKIEVFFIFINPFVKLCL